ncbi:retrovirus-related pol polyprotein from transposon TNT 1-94 [Tanacetum coccineum]
METIHVKFDEITAMASEHDCLEHVLQRFNNNNSSAETMNTPSKEDLDNLFGLMFEEYFEKRFSDTLINSAVQPTQFHEDSPSTSSIIVEDHEAPPIETTSDEQTSPLSLTKADEFIQEDSADFDGSLEFVSYNPLKYHHLPNGCQNGFSQWSIKEEVYVSQPEGFIDPEFPDHVYRLKKASYGLKQAPRAWLAHIAGSINFSRQMMGELKFFLGLQVHQSPRDIFISQSQYAIELLKKHGWLMYLIASRPDIAYATFVCARYQARPTVKHLKEVKRIFQYQRQSYNMGLWYPKDSGFELIAYSNADHAGCKDDCKSTSGGLQFLGKKLVSWSSKKQDYTAVSTAKAEYVSLSACCAQVIWMHTQLLDYGYKYKRIPMYCDSKSATAISCNPVHHSKTKHIDIRYHFIKEHVEKGTVELYFVGTEYQLADLFTKALPKERFEYLVHCIGMRCMTPTQLESLTKLSS